MSLALRLTLLLDGGQISPDTYQKLTDTITWFLIDRNLSLTEENASMFITHLAIALERIRKSEVVAPLDTSLVTEIEQSQYYAAAVNIANDLQRVWGVICPESELGFIWLHLCTLLEMEGI